jgi:hypothetical protein
MTKEQKLKVLEKAIEDGADISISFHKPNMDKEEAEQKIQSFAHLFPEPYYYDGLLMEGKNYKWFKLRQPEDEIEEFELTVFLDR